MREFHYVIKDAQGIHARPAALFGKVTITKDGREVDAKRIFGIMGLGAKQGQEIVLKTEGADEDAAMDKLSAFLEANL